MSSSEIPKTINGLKIILGMAGIGDPSSPSCRFPNVEATKELLIAFARRGYRDLDTARNYPPGKPETCEPMMGEALESLQKDADVVKGVPFIIDTKLRFAPPNKHSKEMVEKSIDGSLKALKMEKLHVEYLHGYDETSPIPETCKAMDKAYKEGKFEKFGISNASADVLEQFFETCEAEGLEVKPQVYQGDYSVLSRDCEGKLLDTCRKHGMPYYAYSPAGGGLMNSKAYRERQGGRFDNSNRLGQIYRNQHYKDHLIEAAEKVRELASANGLSGHVLALRWAVWHSKLSEKHGDGIILGASSIEQLNANLDAIESGPLPDTIVHAIEDIWSAAKAKGQQKPQL
ncbi:aldo keto [Moniliophthora roreri]|uniref:NADP-dependent oxidoreductase domain-containing protein n=1 Tax=Moniliophthora roreri TaxID=221103 RepID=A0A0W0FBJ9_MONRR|nr:aldo keto [Moniliophthora roreri]